MKLTPDSSSQSEFERIARISKALGAPSTRTRIGIGDDAAVIEPRDKPLLLCSDTMVEGVHFDLAYCSPTDLGHKALAACLSDIAAMNGTPLAALFSIALPASVSDIFLDEFYKGASYLAEKTGVDIVGGDLSRSLNGLFIDVTCFGETDRPILRSGARPGDLIAVSGYPGASAAGLKALQEKRNYPFLQNAHLRPLPRFDLLSIFQSTHNLCTSMIDISDGIAGELQRLRERSNIGARIEETRLPLHSDVLKLANEVSADATDCALNWAMSGGEDYELLVTLDPSALKNLGGSLPGFTVIGLATEADQGLVRERSDGTRRPLVSTGHDHFLKL